MISLLERNIFEVLQDLWSYLRPSFFKETHSFNTHSSLRGLVYLRNLCEMLGWRDLVLIRYYY